MSEKLILSVFFFYLTAGVFFGDGKQPFVDVWMGSGILLCWFMARHIKKAPAVPHKIMLVWALVLAGLMIQAFFSDSAGYSISAVIRYTEGFLVFLLFSRLSREDVVPTATRAIVFISFAASVSSLVLLIHPQWAENLPLMNLLYANYGHNHAADLLLFTLPVLFFWFTSKASPFRALVFTVCSAAFLLSFARGAWVVFFVYLILLILLRKKEQHKKARPLLLGFIALLVLALGFITVLSYIHKNTKTNLVWWSRQQIIKPLPFEDSRFNYWNQSFRAIQERPWFGSGPGTFLLQSRRLQITPDTWSWFAHSFPLQAIVELGLIGSIPVFILMISLFRFLAGIATGKNEDKGKQALAWGAILTLCYSMFEFNLNYSVIWLLFWAAAGILLRENQKEPQRNTSKSAFQTLAFFLAITALAVYCLLSVVSIVFEAYAKKPGVAFVLSPFDAKAAEKYLAYLKENKLEMNEQENNIIRVFHKNNPSTYSHFIDLATEESEKQQLKERLVILDPWKRKGLDLTKYYFDTNRPELAQVQIEKTLSLWETAKKKLKQTIWYSEALSLSLQMLELGDRYYMKGKPKDAGRWYKEAQLLDAWALHKHRPVFLDYPTPGMEKVKFFLGLGDVSGEHIGKHRNDYVNEYLDSLVGVIPNWESSDYPLLASQIVRIAPWARFGAWEKIGSSLLDKAVEEKRAGQDEKSLTTLLSAVDFWKALVQNKERLSWDIEREFANELVSVGNKMAPSNLSLTIRSYEAAITLVPWAINNKNSWFMQYKPGDISYPSLTSYINQEKNNDTKNPRYTAEATMTLMEKYTADDEAQKAADVFAKHKDVSPVDYNKRKLFVQDLQKKADQYIQTGRQKDAETAVAMLAGVLPGDYWAEVQTGNYYLMIGDLTKAKQVFNECLVKFIGNHADCRIGLESVGKAKTNNEKYWQASQIIQGKAQWQDFIVYK